MNDEDDSVDAEPYDATPKKSKTVRGFDIYDEFTDGYNRTVRVQMSSAAAEPMCWIFTHDAEGDDVARNVVGAKGGVSALSPHLSKDHAKRLIAALQDFVDNAR